MSTHYCGAANPYGIKPYGNAFLAPHSHKEKWVTGRGGFHRVPESVIMDVLYYLDARGLCAMGATSKILYVYCHSSELWRDCTLRRFPGDFNYSRSWKDTMAQLVLRESRRCCSEWKPHVPLPVPCPYAFSDLLHRSWVCRSFQLESACKGFLAADNVAREDGGTLSVSDFVRRYEAANTPLLLKSGAAHWPAMRKRYLQRTDCPDEGAAAAAVEGKPCCENCWRLRQGQHSTSGRLRTYKTTSTTSSVPVDIRFSLPQYAHYAAAAFEEAPLYLFDNRFAEGGGHEAGAGGAAEEFLPTDFDVPKWFKPPAHQTEAAAQSASDSPDAPAGFYTDLFSVLQDGDRRRPDYRWLIAGPAQSGSVFHKDPNGTNAWNAVVQGRKKWLFYPPHAAPPGVFASEDGAEVAVPLSLGEWLLSFWADHVRARTAEDPANRPLECVAEAGDVVFVPSGWWHMVVNLGPEPSVAVTQNYVSTSNLAAVLRFLRDKPEQISGLGGGGAAEVDPDTDNEEDDGDEEKGACGPQRGGCGYGAATLHGEFVRLLRSRLPALDVDRYDRESRPPEAASPTRGPSAGIQAASAAGRVGRKRPLDDDAQDDDSGPQSVTLAKVVTAAAEDAESSGFSFSFF